MLTSVKRAASIIEAFLGARRDWSILELSQRLDIPQPSIHHVLSSFKELGWVTQDRATKRYRLGIKMWEIGCAAINFREVAESARPHLSALVDRCGETAHLGMIGAENPGTVIYVDRVDSQQPVRIVTVIGSRAPSHSSAMGKAILAHNDEFRAHVLASPLEQVTQYTMTDPQLLAEDLRQTRERGYSIGRGEFAGEMIGIAAPVFDHVGNVSLGVGIWAPSVRMTMDFMQAAAPQVMETAKNISRTLGYLGR
ncbi:MAG: IclR family transcriptional regulator [Rhizobium sp.]